VASLFDHLSAQDIDNFFVRQSNFGCIENFANGVDCCIA